MSGCACEINIDYGFNEYHIAQIISTHKTLVCGECNDTIKKGQQHEHVALKCDGRWMRERTCLPCREVRDCYFCSWHYGFVWEYLSNEGDDLALGALESLSKQARDKFFQHIGG